MRFSQNTVIKDSQMGYKYVFIHEYRWNIVLLAICGVVSIVMFDISEHRKWCFMCILLLRSLQFCMYSLYLQSTANSRMRNSSFINIACVFYANITANHTYPPCSLLPCAINVNTYAQRIKNSNLTCYNSKSLPLVQFWCFLSKVVKYLKLNC